MWCRAQTLCVLVVKYWIKNWFLRCCTAFHTALTRLSATPTLNHFQHPCWMTHFFCLQLVVTILHIQIKEATVTNLPVCYPYWSWLLCHALFVPPKQDFLLVLKAEMCVKTRFPTVIQWQSAMRWKYLQILPKSLFGAFPLLEYDPTDDRAESGRSSSWFCCSAAIIVCRTCSANGCS